MSKETFYEEPQLLSSLTAFHEDRSSGELIIEQYQEIPDWWLTEMANLKVDSLHTPSGDLLHVAAVPEVVVDHLLNRYGFDVMNADIRETVKMLKRYALDHFVLTNKRV